MSRLPEMGIYQVSKCFLWLARRGRVRLWPRRLESLAGRRKERDASNRDDRGIGGALKRRRHDGPLPAGAVFAVEPDQVADRLAAFLPEDIDRRLVLEAPDAAGQQKRDDGQQAEDSDDQQNPTHGTAAAVVGMS